MHPNRHRLAIAGLALTACLTIGAADAQQAGRLTRRPLDSGGKLSADKTMGVITVDSFQRLGQQITAAKSSAEVDGTIAALCELKGVTALAAAEMQTAIKKLSKAQSAKLKARDPESLAALSIAVVGGLDNVSPDAIRADEAIGPGAYHDALTAMTAGLDKCSFFGLEKKL